MKSGIRKLLSRTWHRINSEIELRRDPIKYAKARGVSVGGGCRFLSLSTETFGSEPYLVEIGSHVTLTAGVRFVTHDGGVWVLRDKYPNIDVFGPISVGDNVFIGLNAIVLPNVHVGDNCIIGAGAVVTRDIPPNSVAVGVPARVVSSIEDYEARILPAAESTKGMQPSDKRRYLLRKYGGA